MLKISSVLFTGSTFEQLPLAVETEQAQQGTWVGQDELVSILLGDDAEAIAQSLLTSLQES